MRKRLQLFARHLRIYILKGLSMRQELPLLQLFAEQMRIYAVEGPSEAALLRNHATFRSLFAYIHLRVSA